MARAARSVTVLPATLNPVTRVPFSTAHLLQVAAYARVSTDSDEQFTSYEAQIDYYTKYIKSHKDWEFVGVYTDEGITGTCTKHRDGFNQMIQDALDGKIDLIVTKSVSRFARNTVDSLVTVRKLKEKGVEVFFEKENIYTLDSKGELLITIMSSLAQDESRSLSENITWGQRKRFSDGKISLPYAHFLGYRKGPDGLPEIVPEEAEVVREIYDLFMRGLTPYAIAAQLTGKGVPTPSGKEKWQATTVRSILTNEKYKGEALLQKGFTVDFLTHKRKVNEGEVPQYYVENSHPAIITPEEWALVQREMNRRQGAGRKYSGNGVLGSRIVCGDCGGFYAPKTWHSTNEKYRKVVYRCQEKYRGEHRCNTPALDEATIKDRFVMAINELVTDKDAILDDCRVIQATFLDMSGTGHMYPDPIATAHQLKDEIRDTLGFTVNVGVGPNKLLAKMASDFEKPDKVHTLFYEELAVKFWPLPVRDLFSVGHATAEKLEKAYIATIGDLAKADLESVQVLVGKKMGAQLHDFARGIDDSPVQTIPEEMKGYGNSTTLEEDVTTTEEAHRIILALADSVAARMRADGAKAYCVVVSIRDRYFKDRSHQRKLAEATDVTTEIYDVCKQLLSELWDGHTPLRLLGVSLTNVTHEEAVQFSLFEDEKKERARKLDQALDAIREKYGTETIVRAAALQSGKGVGRKHKAQIDLKREGK